jgi:hypothetical protein
VLDLAALERTLLDRLKERLPVTLGLYREAAGLDVVAVPNPKTYDLGGWALSRVEGYPAVFASAVELRETLPAEIPDTYVCRYRFEVTAWARTQDPRSTYLGVRALTAAVRSALLGGTSLAADATIDPTTLRERYTTVEPVSGRTLAGVAIELDILTVEAVLRPATPALESAVLYAATMA